MNAFVDLDRDLGLGEGEAGPSSGYGMDERLREYVVGSVVEDVDSESDDGGHSPMEVDGVAGEKRKMFVNYYFLSARMTLLTSVMISRNGSAEPARSRKRTRLTHPMVEDKDTVELWWDAVHSDDLLANGLPGIRYRSSRDLEPNPPKPARIPKTPKKFKSPLKSKRRKKPSSSPSSPKSLLGLMNNNIRTMKRVRSTHAKFAALNQNQSNEDGGGGETPEPASAQNIPEEGEEADVGVDERPWRPSGPAIEIGTAGAEECLGWMSGKVLEHAGFQGTVFGLIF